MRIIAFYLLISLVHLGWSVDANAIFPDSSHSVVAFTVQITPSQILNSFSPLRAIGAGLDAQDTNAVNQLYLPSTISTMLSSGLGAISYRLYTELGIQQWHWNPNGLWSDPLGQGYWTGTSTPNGSIQDSFGYRLPHRGNTHDQADDNDYSRLTDGDTNSYWKSNPYLDSHFTGEDSALHPQWVVVDLGNKKKVNGISLDWVEPRALDYEVQYWVGDDAIYDPGNGHWVTFPNGHITNSPGGKVTLKLSNQANSIRYLRVLMTRSSGLYDSHGAIDLRNSYGYALAEIGIGIIDSKVKFHDVVHHSPDNHQTITYASSVDPWHSVSDLNTDGAEQVGLDRVFNSGITRDIPTTIPVAMLYGTPDDAAAELQYLESKNYKIARVELGEEPDGQFILPEDYGALYLQWASAIHKVDPNLQLGGPVFQGGTTDVPVWADVNGNTSWLKRFLTYLNNHGRSSDLAFMAFEHYPFNPFGNVQQNLISEADLVRSVIDIWHQDGLSPSIPLFITELNYSASFTQIPQEITGALWEADFFGGFLASGGSGAFFYEYEPEPLFPVPGLLGAFGNLTMFPSDAEHKIKKRGAQYFASQILTHEWCQPIDQIHTLYSVTTTGKENIAVKAYPVLRPDGQWSVLLINNDL